MKFDPLPDTVLLCQGETIRLNAGFLDGIYQWSTGGQDSVLVVDAPGVYRVEVFMDNCVLQDSVRVLDVADVTRFPADTVVCAGTAQILSAPVYGEYVWSTGETSAVISVADEGWYGLTVTNACGVYEYGTTVRIASCDCQWYVPNVISPNRDGLNESMEASPQCDFPQSIVRFEVFDRWGNKVYSADHPEVASWDGTYPDGTQAPGGVYVWRLVFAYVRDGMEHQDVLTGDVTVLR
jgi:gliding motility-associated-like protein